MNSNVGREKKLLGQNEKWGWRGGGMIYETYRKAWEGVGSRGNYALPGLDSCPLGKMECSIERSSGCKEPYTDTTMDLSWMRSPVRSDEVPTYRTVSSCRGARVASISDHPRDYLILRQDIMTIQQCCALCGTYDKCVSFAFWIRKLFFFANH